VPLRIGSLFAQPPPPGGNDAGAIRFSPFLEKALRKRKPGSFIDWQEKSVQFEARASAPAPAACLGKLPPPC